MGVQVAEQSEPSFEEGTKGFLAYVMAPEHWVSSARSRAEPAYQRQVGALRVRASVDVMPTLETFLHISFRAPDLSPMKAVDLLESLIKERFALSPNVEWQVEIDARMWIHFVRRYTAVTLAA